MLRFLGWAFGAGFMVFIGGAVAAVYIVMDVSKDLPDYKQLALYEPPVMTRIHAADGSLLAEYAEQRRLFVPVAQVPKQLIQAFLSAEDKTFYEHGGLDWRGIAAAGLRYVQVTLTGRGQIVGARPSPSRCQELPAERKSIYACPRALLVQRIGRLSARTRSRTLSQRDLPRSQLLRRRRPPPTISASR
jgi:hypothetical protein